MTDAPFFDPWPEPEPDQDGEQQAFDLPWMPPVHVVGEVVPLAANLVRTDDVLVQVTHVVACRRGLELHLGSWLRPGIREKRSGPHYLWEEHEPRVGVRLADGTRVGHRPPHVESSPGEEPAAATFTMVSGNGGGLHSSSSYWLHPLPDGDTIEVVLAWDAYGVPESSVTLPLAPLRAAADREVVLWAPPPTPDDGGYGWFAYAPMGGSAYGSSWAMSFDEDAAEAEGDDEGEAEPGGRSRPGQP